MLSRPKWRRIGRFALAMIVIGIVAPWLLVLPLAFAQPPTTAVMLTRSVQRLFQWKRPIYPRRDVVPHRLINPALHRAVLAAEDDRFFLHYGLDFIEIENALERRRRGRRLRGASTITQQVAKNLFLWEGRSFVRKGLEAYIALVMETCLTKERILDLYLNLAEWGDGIFGAEAASRKYFRKPAARLTRDEAARLAAVLPAPRRWSPLGAVARRRAEIILQRMYYAAPREAAPEPSRRRRR
ncbi:MAG: monofunctional biosynthetic peptidoglycan transglycosylase [Gemmatimonadaceae bacterium]